MDAPNGAITGAGAGAGAARVVGAAEGGVGEGAGAARVVGAGSTSNSNNILSNSSIEVAISLLIGVPAAGASVCLGFNAVCVFAELKSKVIF